MEKPDYQLVVLGNPRGQGRPKAQATGKFARVYEDKKDTQAKETLAAVVQRKAPPALLDRPLRVDLYFYFQRPKSHFGTGSKSRILKRTAPKYYTSKPDRDNLDKLTLDALTGIFWRDDACICQGWIQKEYSDRPRTEIYIKILR